MAKVPSWNDIPFDKNASPEVKADEFDAQFAENKANAPEDKSNPYADYDAATPNLD